ncbi:phosphohydrolase [Tianweitania sp.]|uniref:HD domain-containing protein n=1 Tax=Tianweitania sp. TaxID=2021634 RepID=UPI00289B124C|nr:phosphohydrolase [Tianweitania sp.]
MPEDSLATLGLLPAITDRWFGQLSEPQRHYHTLEHITAMLRNVPEDAAHSRELIAAIWLHDIVYDMTAGDNEECSADQAACDLAGSDVAIKVVQRLIMGTKRHEPSEHPLDALMSDLDLLILSETPEAYQTYAAQIRREYAHVPEDIYRAGRAQVLSQFLQAPIYQTERFASREARARENLASEIADLQSGSA